MHGLIPKGRDLQAGEEVVTCVHRGSNNLRPPKVQGIALTN